MFLFGLALWVNPIEGYCASGNYEVFPSTSITTPYYMNSSAFNFNVNDDSPALQYGVVPFSSFDISLTLYPRALSTLLNDCFLNVPYCYKLDVYVLFTIPTGGAYQQQLGTISIAGTFDTFGQDYDSYNFDFHTSLEGIPTGLRFVCVNYPRSITSYVYTDDTTLSLDVTSSFSYRELLNVAYSFNNFSFDQSSASGGSSTVINNVNSNLTPIGYSSLNFGVNGNVYFLEDNYIFKPDYISPLMFIYDFANSVTGTIGSSSLTLCMGDVASVSPVRGSPIAVIGDTRIGEYELTLGFCLGSAPSSSELSSLTNLSNWGFEFNRGYSGDQFAMPSNARVSYTNFLDTSKNLYYVNVYFYFTTPDYFDSFLIRKAPSLRNIRVGAFAFNKYTGTISDQLTQSSQQWDYQNPSHSSFSSANSSAASTVSAFSSIEADAFSNLDTAMSGAGVNDFNINVISTPLATVSGMINQTYNILPDLIKWLILAILVIGIFAVIISANNYVNKD